MCIYVYIYTHTLISLTPTHTGRMSVTCAARGQRGDCIRGALQGVTVLCSVLQCVAVCYICCSVLQCVTVRYRVLQ